MIVAAMIASIGVMLDQPILINDASLRAIAIPLDHVASHAPAAAVAFKIADSLLYLIIVQAAVSVLSTSFAPSR